MEFDFVNFYFASCFLEEFFVSRGMFYFQGVCVVFSICYILFPEGEEYNGNMEIEIKYSHNYTNFIKDYTMNS